MSEIKKPAKTALPKKSTTAKVVKSPKVEAPQQVSNHVHYVEAAQIQPNNVAPSPPTVIVQNILKGPLFISDIGMEFGALEAKDLTYEDPSLVKRSQDLRKALQLGHLVRISQEELDNILAMRIAEARAETQRIGGGNQRTRNVKVNDRIVQAEVLNLNKAAAGRAEQNQINTAGYENDPMSYASAFQEARAQYEDRGVMLDANTFSSMVKNKPSLIQSLLRGDSIFNDGVISGVSTHARATVITKGDGYNTGVAQMNMTNYNRDQRIAGADQIGMTGYQNRDGYLTNPDQMPAHHIPDLVDLDNLDDDDDDDSGYAEEIDLSSEVGSSNGIRKLS